MQLWRFSKHFAGLSLIFFTFICACRFAHGETRTETISALMDSDDILSKIEFIPPETNLPPADDAAIKSLSASGLTDVTPFFSSFANETHFAHILASPGLSRFVAIRYDYKLKKASYLGRVIKLPDSHFLVNTRTRSGRSVSLYFEGFAQNEINRVIFQVQQSPPSKMSLESAQTAALSLLIPQSCAAETGVLDVARVVLAHPEPFVRTIENYTAATLMKAVSACAKPFIDTVTDIIHMNVNWQMLNPFTSPTAKIFNLARMLFVISRDLVHTVMTEVENVIRKRGMTGSHAISLACSIIGGVLLRPVQAELKVMRGRVLKHLSDPLETHVSKDLGAAFGAHEVDGYTRLTIAAQKIRWSIEDAKETIRDTFEKIPGSKSVEKYNASTTSDRVNEYASSVIRTQRAVEKSQSSQSVR